MRNMYMKCIVLMMMICLSAPLYAQNTISGTVSDSMGPLPGVSVLVKGTDRGLQTDANGQYSIQASEGDVISFSMIGFTAQEVVVGDQSVINVTMLQDNQALDEVVVTALGIQREKKSLGYAMQEIGGDALVQANEPNLTNALTGKVAGLQVVKGGAGPGSSSKIVLRGFTSLTGDNQPLIVIDGVPMDNFTGASNNDFWNPSLDMGNGLGDINPDDIASMSVLKGASAAALYGSRAGNGVIQITTKSGRKSEGLGITYSTSVGFESAFTTPEMQDSFGQGTEGVFDNQSGSSWGPAITGQTVENWNGEQVSLRAYDNVNNYFGKGISQKHNLSLSQSYNNTSVYSSVSYMGDDSQIPGAELERFSFLTKATTKFGKEERWTAETKVNYINTKAFNRPMSGSNPNNAFTTMYLFPRSLDITGFEDSVDEFGNMIWYNAGNGINPYWNSLYNRNEDARNRFLVNGLLKYQFTEWLNGELRAGADIYQTSFNTKLNSGSPLSATGRYSLGKNDFNETNLSALFTAQKDYIWGKWGGAASLGGNLMAQKSTSISSNAGELVVPNLFSINNGVGNPTVSEGYSERRINSVYGTAQINYDGYFFLEGTFRNDWSSTLKDPFFYPSINTSLVLTEMINKSGGDVPSWMSYAKVRASYAEVGNDLGAYQLYNTYWIGKDPDGNTTAGRNGTLYNEDVVAELIKSWEAGAEIRFLNNRFGIDFSWYKTNSINQLITLPMNPLSGYTGRIINAGNIENKGVEIMTNALILDNPEGLSWNLNVNYSKNQNTIVKLADDVKSLPLGGFDNIAINATEGEYYGDIWGTSYRRVTDESSEYFGQLLLNENGLPVQSNEKTRLGNQSASDLLGVINTFAYQGLTLGFQVDARFGGQVFAGTHQMMQLAGTAGITAPGGSREDMVVDGVIASGDGYVENTTPVTVQQYWGAVAGVGNTGISEANIYDATNIRLRTVTLDYNLPKRFFDNTPIQNAKIGLSMNNVWMIHSKMNGLDPESTYATGTNAVGFEYGSGPTTRSFLVNLSVSF
ncbi:SusC/RagA family TonB-linked outer membrane protein [Albibacterium profundi]|uniref:SusC/RagA family TonB-linked outer membrane protein n=1 Tax=Albibacterium profundi TaxID=3134906 RepID=A0ABV5CGK6_9SPHI